jgi:transglutaminase-like putative cysteine protease
VIYDIRHLTTYSYEAPVGFARCTMRLIPTSSPGQKVLWSRLSITPAPSERRERVSFFGHVVVTVTIETPHSELSVEAHSRVDVDREGQMGLFLGRGWEDIRAEAFASNALSAASPAHYLYPSRLVSLDPAITAYAERSFTQGRPLLEAVDDLTGRIKAEFAYDTKATAVSTPLKEAFEHRRGVCQDFAHIMIAGLRGLGLPAAYVSGYLRTVPPPGQKRLEGADATHAWVAVWAGSDLGWIGFDPTNNMRALNDHIDLATGRDYADISPVDGVILGAGDQDLDVKVDVVPVGAAGA